MAYLGRNLGNLKIDDLEPSAAALADPFGKDACKFIKKAASQGSPIAGIAALLDIDPSIFEAGLGKPGARTAAGNAYDRGDGLNVDLQRRTTVARSLAGDNIAAKIDIERREAEKQNAGGSNAKAITLLAAIVQRYDHIIRTDKQTSEICQEMKDAGHYTLPAPLPPGDTGERAYMEENGQDKINDSRPVKVIRERMTAAGKTEAEITTYLGSVNLTGPRDFLAERKPDFATPAEKTVAAAHHYLDAPLERDAAPTKDVDVPIVSLGHQSDEDADRQKAFQAMADETTKNRIASIAAPNPCDAPRPMQRSGVTVPHAHNAKTGRLIR
jgi:hypothetical protein